MQFHSKFYSRGDRPVDPCPFCSSHLWHFKASFIHPPKGETDFGVTPYRRDLWQCGGCAHIINQHDFSPETLYDAAYWDRTYGAGRIAAIFDRIMALPKERSDNMARVARIQAFTEKHGILTQDHKALLDVGSGLAVFPAVMAQKGWRCLALDPDPRSAKHACEKAGVDSVAADFMTFETKNRFHLITFNKVLEHIRIPVSMLYRAHRFLYQREPEGPEGPEGIVYMELPDGERAIEAGADREEFFIEHYDAYSKASFYALAEQAKFQVMMCDRFIEPSGKYTLFGFLRRKDTRV